MGASAERPQSHWETWHQGYDDPLSGVSLRLAAISEQISSYLDLTAPRPVRVVSLCAGDGRDLLGVLETRPDADRVSALLVELDPGLTASARARAAASRAQVEVRCADAGALSSYEDALPAGLVLLCGVLGNICDDDVQRTVEAMGWFCADGGRVIWTRSRREPDLTPLAREWFRDNGFRELAFLTWPGRVSTVGVHERVSARADKPPPSPLFTFTGDGT